MIILVTATTLAAVNQRFKQGCRRKPACLIEEKYGISKGLGAIVDTEDFRPWLHDARINGEIGDFYWSRYLKRLNLKGLPKSVIDAATS